MNLAIAGYYIQTNPSYPHKSCIASKAKISGSKIILIPVDDTIRSGLILYLAKSLTKYQKTTNWSRLFKASKNPRMFIDFAYIPLEHLRPQKISKRLAANIWQGSKCWYFTLVRRFFLNFGSCSFQRCSQGRQWTAAMGIIPGNIYRPPWSSGNKNCKKSTSTAIIHLVLQPPHKCLTS